MKILYEVKREEPIDEERDSVLRKIPPRVAVCYLFTVSNYGSIHHANQIRHKLSVIFYSCPLLVNHQT